MIHSASATVEVLGPRRRGRTATRRTFRGYAATAGSLCAREAAYELLTDHGGVRSAHGSSRTRRDPPPGVVRRAAEVLDEGKRRGGRRAGRRARSERSARRASRGPRTRRGGRSPVPEIVTALLAMLGPARAQDQESRRIIDAVGASEEDGQ